MLWTVLQTRKYHPFHVTGAVCVGDNELAGRYLGGVTAIVPNDWPRQSGQQGNWTGYVCRYQLVHGTFSGHLLHVERFVCHGWVTVNEADMKTTYWFGCRENALIFLRKRTFCSNQRQNVVHGWGQRCRSFVQRKHLGTLCGQLTKGVRLAMSEL